MAFKFIKLNATQNGWYDTGINVTVGERILINASGKASAYASGSIAAGFGDREWNDPNGYNAGNNGTTSILNGLCGGTYDSSSPDMALLGKIGISGSIFRIGRRHAQTVTTTGRLYVVMNDCPLNYGDNRGAYKIRILTGLPGKSKHNVPCPCANDNKVRSDNPIELADGNKVLSMTDFVLQTASGTLAFEREYNQSQRNNPRYQFMGLGWSHRLGETLVMAGTSPTRTAQVYFANGGVLKLNESGANQFVAEAGSTSSMTVSGANFILTAQDKSTYEFEPTATSGLFRLKVRRWPTTEAWTYTYTSDKLVQVDDGYGRQIKLSYRTAAGFDNGQLWWVGDQTASGLDTATPSGRYVEFTYTPEKNNGVTIANPKALLASVRDVRGQIWSYEYYGQLAGQSDTTQLNLLTKRLSPSVDTNGDGTLDGSLTLEELTYTYAGSTLSQVIQKRGNALLQTTFKLRPDANRSETEEIVAGLSRFHLFSDDNGENGTYVGTEVASTIPDNNPDDNSQVSLTVPNTNYRPDQQVDGEGNVTALQWSSNGKLLNNVTDALNNQTQFTYNANDTLKDSTDAQGRKTEYTYGDPAQPRLPTRVRVLDTNGTTVLRWQEFTYDAKGRTLEERTLDPANGTTILQKTSRTYGTTGNDNGLLKTVTVVDVLTPANNTSTTYSYDAAGRLIKTQQSSLFGSCQTSFTLYDPAGNVLASICNYDPGANPDPTTLAAAIALYNPALPDKNKVTTHEYDSLNRRIKMTANAGASFAQTSLTFYDALDRVVRTITNYVNQSGGSAEAPATWVWDTVDNRWEKSTGAAIGHGTDNTQNIIADTDFNQRGMVRFTRDMLGKATLYGYNNAGRLIKTIHSASQPTYNNDYIVRPDLSGAPNATLDTYAAATAPDQDLVTAQDYDRTGNLVKSVDSIGNVNFTVYDALNRVVKIVANAKDTATIALDAGDAGYNAANDPRSASYVPDASVDRDHIQSTEYDSLGRVIRQTDVSGRVTYTVYDSLGRVIRTITNYVAQATTNPANWFWNETTKLWQRGSSDSTPIDLGAKNDQNSIRLTVYDTAGRILYTQDMLGRRAWNRYDGLNRVIKTVANAVGTATNGSNTDPRSDTYVVSPDSDKDRIVRTDYDTDGRVATVTDPNGRKTQNAYDTLGRLSRQISNYVVQGSSLPINWVWSITNNRWENGAGVAISFGTDNDENRISLTEYDSQGRVARTRDAAGIETRYEYDILGRRTRTITNYVDGVFNPAFPDEDLIATTVYDRAGRVMSTTDVRGTQTTFSYDRLGRRLITAQAANTPLVTLSYTCYDKAGRVLRTIQNWSNQPTQPSPDAKDVGGNWLFRPTNGASDRDLITEYQLDRVGRQVQIIDPMGNITQMVYDKAGQVISLTDPENMVTRYGYDNLRRRWRVVQNFIDQGQDPALWVWDGSQSRWETSTNVAIAHGANNDQNTIVDVAYDKAGRIISQREPRGNLTTYEYDLLDRRTKLTNPLNTQWLTAYSHPGGGKTRQTMTYPGLGAGTYAIIRDFDKFDRLQSIAYGDPANTRDVRFIYDVMGNRQKMSEFSAANFTSKVRETNFSYDDVHRLTSVGIDSNGDGTVDETVSYQYDAGGLRTRLTMPGGLQVNYTYDAKGQLISLTDWDSQPTTFAYDQVGRHIATERPERIRSRYQYDAGGRLRLLRHMQGSRTLSQFAYEVDRRGNRTRALEVQAHPATTTDTTIAFNDKGILTVGAWADVSGFKETTAVAARLSLLFLGNQAILTMGTGPDHGIYDVYIGGSLWDSFNGYASVAGQVNLTLPLVGSDLEGPHVLEIRARQEKSALSTGYKVRFNQLVITDATFTLNLIGYTYDGLSRLRDAKYYPGINMAALDADLPRRYQYQFDRSGNRTQQSVTLNGAAPTVTNYTYNAANRITNAGFTYDPNGNLTAEGNNTYTWDRANRMLETLRTVGADSWNTKYRYDGFGNRTNKNSFALVGGLEGIGPSIFYLMDLQPGLAVTLREQGYFIHGPRGVHAQKGFSWSWTLQDGLGSVRGMVNSGTGLAGDRVYDPYGVQFSGFAGSPYGFTGEITDSNGSNTMVHLRARNYNPALGVFTALDPFEGMMDQAMSLNGYAWVEGNTPNAVDPSGLCFEPITGLACAAAVLILVLTGCSSTPTPTPAPTATPSPYRLTSIDWVAQGLVAFGSGRSGASWGAGNQDGVLLALDLISRVTTKTPNDMIRWVTGRANASRLNVYAEQGNSVGAGFAGGQVIVYAANVDNSVLTTGGIGVIVHELAHGVDESQGNGAMSFTESGGFNAVGWSKATGSWIYSGSNDLGSGKGPANNYLDNPAEDFANSFAAVVFELNINLGLTSTNGNTLSGIIALDGDRNGDGVVGIDELGPVDPTRRSIVQNML